MPTNSDTGTERRRYHRIDDEVGLKFQVLSESELDSALENFGDEERDLLAVAASFASTSHRMKLVLDPVKGDFPELAIYLEGLNEKLDMLVRLMALADQDFPNEPTHTVSLSASGVSFDVPNRIEVGTILDLKLLLFPSHVCVRSLSTVVISEPGKTGDPAAPYRVRADFSDIREEDRELIIKHVIQKESSMRRRQATEGE